MFKKYRISMLGVLAFLLIAIACLSLTLGQIDVPVKVLLL